MYDSRPERGLKRTCQSCEARFYDLTRSPAICPKCGTEFIEVVRPVSVPYQSRKRGFFGKNRPEEPSLEPAAEEPEARAGDDEEHEPGEEGERELDGEGDADEPHGEEGAEE